MRFILPMSLEHTSVYSEHVLAKAGKPFKYEDPVDVIYSELCGGVLSSRTGAFEERLFRHAYEILSDRRQEWIQLRLSKYKNPGDKEYDIVNKQWSQIEPYEAKFLHEELQPLADAYDEFVKNEQKRQKILQEKLDRQSAE